MSQNIFLRLSELEAKDNPETFACKSVFKNCFIFVFCSLLCMDLIAEKLKKRKTLPRKSTFRIFPLQLSTSAEKQKDSQDPGATFSFSAEVNSYMGKIQKVDIRASIFFHFFFSVIRSTLKDEQETKKEQFLMADSHAKVSGLSFASSSDNLKKTF